MLKEIMPVHHAIHETKKRWFSDSNMDIFIWFQKNAPVRFLLSFNKQGNEHAIRWTQQGGFQYFQVDAGENTGTHYKQSPILHHKDLHDLDNNFDTFDIARQFLAQSDGIETDVADFIYAHLMTYFDLSHHQQKPNHLNQTRLS